MTYAAKEDNTPEFATLLWRYMQQVGKDPMSRKEMAARLTKVGFATTDNSVSQWLTGQRTPPPGLPYYATLALGLEGEDGQALAWAFSRSYKDNRKGAGRSGNRTVAKKPNKQTAENVSKIHVKRKEYEGRAEDMREVVGDSHRTGDRN